MKRGLGLVIALQLAAAPLAGPPLAGEVAAQRAPVQAQGSVRIQAQAPAEAPAQTQAQATGRDGAATPATGVQVVTIGQGDAIWERFGHNFLAIPDPATGRSIAYNWGVFDFAAPDFLSRFLLGDTRYWMEGADLAQVLQYYGRTNRAITVQRLALTPAQADTLRAFLAWNARPENRFYRYDYFRDNCSTRLRDALDLALGGELRRATAQRITNLTYRSESVRLTDEAKPAQLGIAIALGQPADALLSAWESMFVPMRLQEYLRDIQVPGPSGTPVPLVAEEAVVFQPQRVAERTRAPGLFRELAIPGLLIATLIAGLAHAARRGRSGAGRIALLLGAAWGMLAGAIGIVLILAWVATSHVFWYRNENLLHFDPAALALVVLLPLALSRPALRRPARFVAYGVALVSALGAVLKFMPWMMQDNWAIVLFALPIHLAVAYAVSVMLGPAPARVPGRARRRDEAGPRAVS